MLEMMGDIRVPQSTLDELFQSKEIFNEYLRKFLELRDIESLHKMRTSKVEYESRTHSVIANNGKMVVVVHIY